MEGSAPEKVQLGAEKGEGHQLLQGEVDGRDVLEAGKEAVDFVAAQPLGDQRIAGLLNGVKVAMDGAAVDAALLGQLINGDPMAGLDEPDNVMNTPGLGIFLRRLTLLHWESVLHRQQVFSALAAVVSWPPHLLRPWLLQPVSRCS